MTKMVALSIYGIKHLKIFFSESLDRFKKTWHVVSGTIMIIEYYNMFINHDPVMTLKDITARSY